MPKSKASNVIQIGLQNLVDAKTMGSVAGFTEQYINRMAAKGKISWHGVRNGVKVYRRYDPLQVLHELKHGVEASDTTGKPKPTARTERNKSVHAE
jgi:hypothetical protein